MSQRRATFIGFSAILLWASLALLTIGSAPVPPFQLNAMTFGIGAAVGLIWTARRGFGILRGISWRVYAFGTAGLFGYHALYFTAFRLGPDASTGLIAYLWPLLIVLLSGLLPHERMHRRHIGGAVLGFGGAALIVLQSGSAGVVPAALVLGFLCALTWAAYSVASRAMGDVPTEAVTVFCGATAALSLLAHMAFETTAWPTGGIGWASVIALGLGPVGAAFFTWDIGMKHGDIQLLGAASYAAPLLSTLALIAVGINEPTPMLGISTLLIVAGAALAASASDRGA
jgi:drug/metabolite transporter (DMT)-like permease